MTFYQYLTQKGLLHKLDASSNELSALRKEYRRVYQKMYQKQYAKNRICRLMVFTFEEYETLKKASKDHKLPFTTFVRESALKYLSNDYIVPSKEQTKDVLVALKRYGVNLNQIAHLGNAQKFISDANIKDIQQNFKLLEENIRQIYINPLQVIDFIREILSKKPEYASQIKSLLDEFKTSI